MVIDNLEIEYNQRTPLEHRKKFAQFFTPYKIADIMSQWLVGNKKLKNVLEPAFGLGIFSRILLQYNKNLNIKGFEIDKNIFDEASKFFEKEKNVKILLEDYMYNDWKNKYDGIICNPPYFKFQNYDNKNIINEIEDRLSLKLNGFTNLYALFLLKSINQLNKNGRAAYIIPSEFLNSDYGKLVKEHLIKNKTLRHVIVINFEKNVFDDVLTTASILLFANDDKVDSIKFSNIKNLDDLNELKELINKYPENINNTGIVRFKELNPEIKWRSYYQLQNSKKYKNLVSFSNYGKVMRGIATGANEYFVFSKSKAEKFGIKSQYLLPCICRSAHIKNSFFTKDDFADLQNADKEIFLFNAVNIQDNKVKDYISLGQKNDIDKKFLTSRRNPWFLLENRQPAPIWVSVFNRDGLKFIKNEANISNLTTFHCIYLNMFSLNKIDLLFAYLLTDISREIFEDNRREYGNGLKKFEPNDINKAKMLDLNKLSIKTENKILDFYHEYRQSILDKRPNKDLLNKINNIFVENYS